MYVQCRGAGKCSAVGLGHVVPWGWVFCSNVKKCGALALDWTGNVRNLQSIADGSIRSQKTSRCVC